MPLDFEQAKAILGITEDISEIYKVSDSEKGRLRNKFNQDAISLAKGKTNEEQQKIEEAHDVILSYLNQPADTLTPKEKVDAIKSIPLDGLSNNDSPSDQARQLLRDNSYLFNSEMLVDIASTSVTHAYLILENPNAAQKLTNEQLAKIFQQYPNDSSFLNTASFTSKSSSIAKRAIEDVNFAQTAIRDPDMHKLIHETVLPQIIDKHKDNADFRTAMWDEFTHLHTQSRTATLDGKDNPIFDSKVVQQWHLLVEMTKNASYNAKNDDLLALDQYRESNSDLFARVAKLETKTDQPNTPEPEPKQEQPVIHARTAVVPPTPPKPPNKKQDPVKNAETMIERIIKAIDTQNTNAYKPQIDSSGNAMILKGEKPILSVQPEKISLMEPFGKPPGSDADIKKVEMLVKAGNAAFGQAIIYSTNPEHKEFLQQQADRLGVKFADTPEKLAELKEKRAASLGTTISSLDTTQQPKPNSFGNTHTPKPLPQTPPNPKVDFQKAIDALTSNDKTVKENYLKILLKDGKNSLFEIKPNDKGEMEISVTKTGKLSDTQEKELAKAFVNATRSISTTAEFNTDSSQKTVSLSLEHFNSLKTQVGLETTVTKQQQTIPPISSTTSPKSPAQEAIEALNGDQRNEYLKDLVEKGENEILKIETNNGAFSITSKEGEILNRNDLENLQKALLTAISDLTREKTPEADRAVFSGIFPQSLTMTAKFSEATSNTLKQELGIQTHNKTLK